MPKGCIIYCIERGILEKHTLLSIASIKQYGGLLRDYDIFCVQPRKEFPISRATKNKLSSLDVTFIDKPLNVKHRYYSIANKPLVINFVMTHFHYDQYLFLDGDTIIVNEPYQFFTDHNNLLLSPVYTKRIGIKNLYDKNAGYWNKLFELTHADLDSLPTINTLLEKDEIISYWNAGIMLINGNENLVDSWAKFMIRLLDNRIYPESGIFFVEQSALAATLISKKLDPGKLNLSHNFPLTRKVFHISEFHELEKLCIIHHLNNLYLLSELPTSLLDEEKKHWIQNQLNLLKIYNTGPFEQMMDKYYALTKNIKERFYYFIYKFTNHKSDV